MEKLTDVLWHYTSSTSNMYDKEFTETLHKLRPDWKVIKPKKVVVVAEPRVIPERVKPQILGVELDGEWPSLEESYCLDGFFIYSNPCQRMFNDYNEGPKKYKLDALINTVNYTLSKENLLGKMPYDWEKEYEKSKILQMLKEKKPIAKKEAVWLRKHIKYYTRIGSNDKDFADKVSKIYKQPWIIGKTTTRVCNKVRTIPKWAERL